MKKFLFIAIVLLSAAGGAWYAHHRAMTTPADGESGHHAWVSKTDAEGKTYWTCSMHPQVHQDHPGNCPICGMTLIEKADPAAAAPTSSNERKPLYWYDPMKPDQHFDKPGKSPFMDMELMPRYADESVGGSANIISIDPRTVQNLGIRTATVERRSVAQELQVTGTVAVNENRIEVVQTRAAGWVERLHVRALNDAVRKGQLLAEIYAPDVFTAQQEFLLALQSGDAALSNAARQRLLLLGMNDRQVAQLEKAREAQRRVAYYAPADGIVTDLGVRDGAQVNPGMTLFTLADLSQVWINAEVPEALASNLRPGSPVEAQLAALAGDSFKGKIDYVYPEVDAQTRTVRVRAIFANKGLLLKPGMFAAVVLGKGGQRQALMVPSEAVIRTGTRSTIILARGEGRFQPVEVKLGLQQDGLTEILDGVEEGQQVVASGQFLIDSEANLRGAFSKLDTADKPVEKMDSGEQSP